MRRQPITPKQKNFVHEYLKSGNATDAIQKSYNVKNRRVANSNASKILYNPNVIKYMESVLDKAGLDDDTLVNHLKRVIDIGIATEASKKATPADSLRGLEMAFRLKDRFPATKTVLDKKEVSIKLDGKNQEQLLEQLDEVRKQIQGFSEMVRKQKVT